MTHYELVTRPRSKNVDIVRRSIPDNEWHHVATIASLETGRLLVAQLNIGADVTDQDNTERDEKRIKRGKKWPRTAQRRSKTREQSRQN